MPDLQKIEKIKKLEDKIKRLESLEKVFSSGSFYYSHIYGLDNLVTLKEFEFINDLKILIQATRFNLNDCDDKVVQHFIPYCGINNS